KRRRDRRPQRPADETTPIHPLSSRRIPCASRRARAVRSDAKLKQHVREIRILERRAISELLLVARAAVAALGVLVVEIVVAELLHSRRRLSRVPRVDA